MLSFKDYVINELFDTKLSNPWIEILPNEMYECNVIAPNGIIYGVQLLGDTSINYYLTEDEVNQLPADFIKIVNTNKPFNLAFSQRKGKFAGDFDITGTGDAAFVFGAVISSVKDLLHHTVPVFKRVSNVIWPDRLDYDTLNQMVKKKQIEETNPPSIKVILLSAKEPSRVKLYDRMASSLSKGLNLNYNTVTTKDDKYYIFVVKD